MSETQVQNNLPNTYSMQAVKFRFKKDKLGNQRPSIEMKMPVPTAEGVVEILTKGDKKQWDLVEEALYEVVRGTLAGFVAEESFDPAKFDVSKLFWEAIANMPKEDRRSSSIPEEQWNAFVSAYLEVMPSVTKKTPEQIENATKLFVRKLAPVKSDKGVVGKLKDQLALFAQQPQAEQFSDILELLLKRCETYLSADDMAAIVGNL